MVPRFGVPVFELQSHHDEDTGDSGTPADKVFSGAIPFSTAAQNATATIVFYKQTGPSTRVTLFTLEQDGEAPDIVEAPTTTGGGTGVDVGTGTTILGGRRERMSRGTGAPSPALSADGQVRRVPLVGATNLLDGHNGGSSTSSDLETGDVEAVDVTLTETDGGGRNPSISGDGRYVAFQSSSPDLVEGPTTTASPTSSSATCRRTRRRS